MGFPPILGEEFLHQRDWIEKSRNREGPTKVFIAEALVKDKDETGPAGRADNEDQACERFDATGTRFILAGAVILHDRWVAHIMPSRIATTTRCRRNCSRPWRITTLCGLRS
jgi:hypothetical protein